MRDCEVFSSRILTDFVRSLTL